MEDPGERRPTQSLLDRTRKRIEALCEFGADASALSEKLANAEKQLVEGSEVEARLAMDELLIFMKILCSEIERMISGSSTGETREVDKPKTSAGDSESIEMANEAFQRCLHSSALRRMVEVIALEKIQSVLSDEFVSRDEVEKLLAEMRERQGKENEVV